LDDHEDATALLGEEGAGLLVEGLCSTVLRRVT
jgi:hypothetical protein